MRALTESDRLVGVIEASTIGDIVLRAAQQWDHDAVVFPHERDTYPQFAARVDHFARGFVGLGIERGDAVGILLPAGLDYLAAVIGAATIGAIAVPINARFKSRELSHVIGNSEMRMLLTSADVSEFVDWPGLVEESLPSLASQLTDTLDVVEAPRLRHVSVFGPVGPAPWQLTRERFDAAAAKVGPEIIEARRYLNRIRDIGIIMYTSGTTASPKGAMLSHEAMVRHGFTVSRTRLKIGPHDKVWAPLPLFHIGGIAFAFACFASGATYVHSGFFDPATSLKQLHEERCTVAIPTFETIWLAMLNHPDFESSDLSPLRLVFNVGNPVRLRQQQERLPNAPQVSGFGSTEASSFLTMGEADDPLDERVNTTGRPLPGIDLRIVDPETNEPVPAGTTGEIVYRGYSVFDGYYNDPERTAESVDADGWFHSGDLGHVDEEGRLTFVSRLKDMLKVGGENVAAAEVEAYLVTHPAVMFAQVVSAPDARYTEVPAAFIQLADGETATEEDLIDYCLGTIATFKVPRYVRFVDEYPMSGTKIQKYVLRERIAAELEAGGITEAPRLRS